MKILIAPDSYKGTLSSLEAIEIIAKSAIKIFPDAQIVKIPVADGGEGTVEAISHQQNLKFHTTQVVAPMGNKIDVTYPITQNNVAIIEMAAASGISLVPLNDKNPMLASSYGTGELILNAVKNGATSIIIGIGGSATNDGGMGAMCALGVKFYDKDKTPLLGNGGNLALIDKIDISNMDKSISQCKINVICDVTNPLLGKDGATAIYGAQKGVTSETMPILENGMKNYSDRIISDLGKDISTFKGAGAAGGMGGCLSAFLNASLASGIDVVLNTINFDSKLSDVDIVITGEGNIDSQSVKYGKVPTGIMRRCKTFNIPVIVIAGGMGDGAELFWEESNGSIMTTINSAMPIEKALENAACLLDSAAERTFRILKMGIDINKA